MQMGSDSFVNETIIMTIIFIIIVNVNVITEPMVVALTNEKSR